jgi:uncharacterized lipoprotein YddW (UPF0748 family)
MPKEENMCTQLRRLMLAMLIGAASLMMVWLASVPVARSVEVQEERHSAAVLSATQVTTVYLPLVAREAARPEVRALWVSRYDWTRYGVTATAADVQQVVSDAARAGFNTIFFQVRGAGDAYYTPGPEPWASRLTGSLGPTLGRDPGLDPLAIMISLAHQSGISIQAYINVYPAWQAPPLHPEYPTKTYGLITPTLGLNPPQWLNQLTYAPSNGRYGLKSNWRVYDSITHPMPISWGEYVWASPAVTAVQDSVLTVTAYLLSHYPLDGIHLDYVRYPGSQYSYDPFTLAAFSQALALSPTLTITSWRGDFQRMQVSHLVTQIHAQTTDACVLLSAAVWPRYTQGRDEYFQDSKAWLLSGIIDAIAPMMYSTDMITDLARWTEAAQDFQASASGRWVLPGIGVESDGCVSFDQIAVRIQAARALGAAGQALFSYGALRDCQAGGVSYLDLLRSGPYAVPAPMLSITWK